MRIQSTLRHILERGLHVLEAEMEQYAIEFYIQVGRWCWMAGFSVTLVHGVGQ